MKLSLATLFAGSLSAGLVACVEEPPPAPKRNPPSVISTRGAGTGGGGQDSLESVSTTEKANQRRIEACNAAADTRWDKEKDECVPVNSSASQSPTSGRSASERTEAPGRETVSTSTRSIETASIDSVRTDTSNPNTPRVDSGNAAQSEIDRCNNADGTQWDFAKNGCVAMNNREPSLRPGYASNGATPGKLIATRSTFIGSADTGGNCFVPRSATLNVENSGTRAGNNPKQLTIKILSSEGCNCSAGEWRVLEGHFQGSFN